MVIKFPEIIQSLSDDSFTNLKNNTKYYIRYYFLNWENTSRDVFIEKLGEYLSHVETSNKVKDDKLANLYASSLFKYVDNRIYRSDDTGDPRVIQYFNRLIQIGDTIKAGKDDLLPLLEDYTKVFLCLYSQYVNHQKRINKIQFDLSKIDFEKVYGFLIKDEPETYKLEEKAPLGMDAFVPKEVLRKVDDAVDKVDDLRKGVQQFTNDLSKWHENNKRNKDYSEYPVYKVTDYYSNQSLYSAKNFSLLLLRIIYYRLKDIEEIINLES